MSYFTYLPVDEIARDGRFHSLRAEDGSLHCGCWHAARGCWTYSSDVPINRTITHYCTRATACPPQQDGVEHNGFPEASHG